MNDQVENWLEERENFVNQEKNGQIEGNESHFDRNFNAPRHPRSLWGREKEMGGLEVGIPPSAFFIDCLFPRSSLFSSSSSVDSFGLISDGKGILLFDEDGGDLSFKSLSFSSSVSLLSHSNPIKSCKSSIDSSIIVLASNSSLYFFRGDSSFIGIIQIFKKDSSRLWTRYNPKYKSYSSPSNFASKTSLPPVFVKFSPNGRFIIYTSKGNSYINICEMETGYLYESLYFESPIKGLLLANDKIFSYHRNRNLKYICLPIETIISLKERITLISTSIGSMRVYFDESEGKNSTFHFEVEWKEEKIDIGAGDVFSPLFVQSLCQFNRRNSSMKESRIALGNLYVAFADEGSIHVYCRTEQLWKHVLLSIVPQNITLSDSSILSIISPSKRFLVDLSNLNVLPT
eukprot:TRINITY_DN2774_c0_g1_i5.p1 TRINITY_DN2774_c0_g1~~TRINITY_DN2774_c0_g1_i5.p1  ORF type:complete len:402 (-),score=120.86 TRINITY_DN2774_c0_g1_i5:1065-2270(-)